MIQLNKKHVSNLAKAMVANGGMAHAKALEMIASSAGFRSYSAMLPTLKEDAAPVASYPDLEPLFEAVMDLWNSSSDEGCEGGLMVIDSAPLLALRSLVATMRKTAERDGSEAKPTPIVVWIADGKVSQVSSANPMEVLVIDLDYQEGGHMIEGQACTIGSAHNVWLGTDMQAFVDEVKQAFEDEEAAKVADANLRGYRVTLKEDAGDKFTIVFDCQAEDDDHAEEQAENAYPGCEIVLITPFEDLGEVANAYEGGVCPNCGTAIPLTAESGESCQNCGLVHYVSFQESVGEAEVAQVNNAEAYVIQAFSPAGNHENQYYWNQAEGWVPFDEATRFSRQERETMELPSSGVEQVYWVPFELALDEARALYLNDIRNDNRWIDGYSLTYLAAQAADLDERQLSIAAHNSWTTQDSSATSAFFVERTEHPNSPTILFELRVGFKRDSDKIEVYSVVRK